MSHLYSFCENLTNFVSPFFSYSGILQAPRTRTFAQDPHHRQGKVFLTEGREQDQARRWSMHLESVNSQEK